MSYTSGARRKSNDPSATSDLQMLFSTISSIDVSGAARPDPAHLHERVASALRRRRDQRSIFPAAVINETCWDIVLLCFLGQLEGRQLCVKQIRNQLDGSNTALLRRIDELEQAGVVERHRDEGDGRRTMVRLTRQGVAAMARFFAPRPTGN